MNILYLIDCNPNAGSYGNEQRTHLLYKALGRLGDVYVLQSSNHDEKVNDFHWLFSLNRQRGMKRLANAIWVRIADAMRPKGPAKYFPFPLLPGIDRYFPGVHFDAVVSRHLDFVNRMHLWKIAPLFIDLDDHPMEVFRTCSLPAISTWRRSLATIVQKLYIWLGLRHATGVWVANPEQERLVTGYGRTAILPNIPFEMLNYLPNSSRQEYVLTVGRMSYAPNRDGVNRFIREIWPSVHEQFPSMRYLVAGKGAPDSLVEEWSQVPGVVVLGFVNDLTELYADALATVVPIYSGGGTCIKVLESLAYSRICLASEFGARGIPVSDISSENCGIFVYTGADSFISRLSRVAHDSKWRALEERLAHEYVTGHYSRERFFEQVCSLVAGASIER